ncbi:hypothetical protein THAOC_33618 [Thalassiosira oceanica]|uniref:Uncharacterized protein n=1 Tax=Thalassiosira oceanica TaxID=159749 RepID=K0R3V2_THAOC|nr:hypothetical protein THAOC_33618 [Thalassiosira oceanica]|eukprot:EJK47648.1 hypothetical protein THAOC_33618 [Thalassiosira oceanica]
MNTREGFQKPCVGFQLMGYQMILIVITPSLTWRTTSQWSTASEDFGDWERLIDWGFDNGKTDEANDYQRSAEYKALKDEKAEALWIALKRIIPDIRERAARKGSVVEVGTPLTHRRFNRRFRGTYCPAPSAGKDVWSLNGAKTPVDGLLACGDCCLYRFTWGCCERNYPQIHSLNQVLSAC